ncbi:MAG: DUF3667 domain-containing protein [Rudaea sp.]
MNTPPDELPIVPLAPTPQPEDAAAQDAQFDRAAPAQETTTRTLCANCGAPLLGEHCYSCGQPVKGMIRQLSSILADFADTVLNIDSRIFRTLLPLYARPGYLTTEYFAGRRVRYVTPFRLYFFLSIAAFFLVQFAVGDASISGINITGDTDDAISTALTRGEVEKQRDAAIARLKTVEAGVGGSDRVKHKIESSIDKIQKRAERRIGYLDSVEQAKAKGEPPPPDPGTNVKVSFGDDSWDPKTTPVVVSWLPQFANDKLTALAVHAKENAARIAKDPKPFVIGSIGVLPQVLFVMMPLFALMLKIMYIFKRRLYMEHLVVALHSHAFIFLSLLMITLTLMASTWAAQSAAWLKTPLDWLIVLMYWWLPIYLFVMQKRVYKQGWIMTTIKYGVIGTAYIVLIAFGVSAAFLVSLATT